METPDAGVLTAARQVCLGWGLTESEAEALVAGDPARAATVIRIDELREGLYSDPLPQIWMTVPNRNPAIGGGEDAPVRPVDHVFATEAGLAAVLRLLEGYAQGK